MNSHAGHVGHAAQTVVVFRSLKRQMKAPKKNWISQTMNYYVHSGPFISCLVKIFYFNFSKIHLKKFKSYIFSYIRAFQVCVLVVGVTPPTRTRWCLKQMCPKAWRLSPLFYLWWPKMRQVENNLGDLVYHEEILHPYSHIDLKINFELCILPLRKQGESTFISHTGCTVPDFSYSIYSD